MGRRSYSGAAAATTLSVLMDTTVLSVTVAAFTNWPSGSGGPFAMTIDRGLATEEKVLVSSITGSVATLLQRGYDGTTAHSHTVGATIEHTITGIDADEANAHVNATGSAHGIGPTEGDFVGTTKVQTLTNKTVDGLVNTLTNIPRTASPELQADIAAETAARTAADATFYPQATVDAHILAASPTGQIIMFGGSVAPTGYLSCNGAAVSRTTYAALFAAIGTTHGAGDGSTTFNLPDLGARNPRGAGGGYTAGQQGGAESHAIAAGNLPAHQHDMTHTHTTPGTNTGNNSVNHSHSIPIASKQQSTSVGMGPDGYTVTGISGSTGANSAQHTHAVPAMTTDSQSTTATGNGPGAGTALPTLDPFTVVLFCIKV